MNDGLLTLQVIQLIVSGECMLLGSVSSQQRFAVTDIKALSVSQLSGLGQTVLQLLDKSVLQLHVTALFYLDNNRKIHSHSRGVRAAAAKSLHSCPTLCVRPHRRQPTRLPRPWDSPGKNTGVGCHFLLQCMKVKSENEVAKSCPTLSDPMDCSLPGSSTHGIFKARVLEWLAIAFSEVF